MKTTEEKALAGVYGPAMKRLAQKQAAEDALKKIYGSAKPLVLHFREGLFIGFCLGLGAGLLVTIGAAAILG